MRGSILHTRVCACARHQCVSISERETRVYLRNRFNMQDSEEEEEEEEEVEEEEEEEEVEVEEEEETTEVG